MCQRGNVSVRHEVIGQKGLIGSFYRSGRPISGCWWDRFELFGELKLVERDNVVRLLPRLKTS
jgi:hypothetical protein